MPENYPWISKGKLLANRGSQDKEYGFDVSLGQTKSKNGVQIGYAWLRQEQDFLIASFNESDQRCPNEFQFDLI